MFCAVLLAWWGVSSCGALPPAPLPLAPPPPQMPQQTPQVLVSVKYGPRGGVDGLLVAQYRAPAPPNGSVVWSPTMNDQRRICTDLCAAGLGGVPCGQACVDVTPSTLIQLNRERSEKKFLNKIADAKENQHASAFSLQFAEGEHKPEDKPAVNVAVDKQQQPKVDPAKNASNDNARDQTQRSSDENLVDSPPENQYKNAPRVEVCPTLCMNDLGWPLCECARSPANDNADEAGPPSALGEQGAEPLWLDVCSSFCPLRLRGCPACVQNANAFRGPYSAGYALFTANNGVRMSNINPGWVEWCSYQCSRGDGGAACNCDRPPFF